MISVPPWFSHSASLQLLLLSVLLGPPALASELRCPASDPPALAVVLWERHNPVGEIFGFELGRKFGGRQYDMREAFLDRMFGIDGILEPGDRVSIFPHGIDAEGPDIDRLRANRGQPGDIYARLKSTFPDDNDPVRSIHMQLPTTDPRGALDRAIRKRVTLPLLDPCPTCPDERGHNGNDETDRDLSYPWLLTHNALAAAYVEQKLAKPCAEPDTVYLVWVTPGMPSDSPEDVFHTIEEELGLLAGSWFRALEGAYWREPLVDDRLVKVWRVHRAAAKRSIAPTWTDSSGDPAALVHSTLWRGGFEELSLNDWSVRTPVASTVHSAEALLRTRASDENPTTVPLVDDNGTVRLADPDALRRDIARRVTERAEDPIEPHLETRLWLLPPAEKLLGWTPVSILEETEVPSPRIRLTYTPAPLWQLALATSGFLVALGLAGHQAYLRLRKRRIEVDVEGLGDTPPVDLFGVREREEFESRAFLSVRDASGYAPRMSSLWVRVSLAAFVQPDVPLHKTDPRPFQRLVGAGWAEDGEGVSLQLPSPRGSLDEHPLIVLTRNAAIDFGRIRADEITVVCALRFQIHDRTGRYRDLDETRFFPLRLTAVPGPAEPRTALDLSPACVSRWLEQRLVAISDAEWRGARRCDIGWLALSNPARHRYTPLPVTFALVSARANATPEKGDTNSVPVEVELRDLAGGAPLADGRRITLESEECTRLVATLVFPERLREPSPTRWEVAVEVDLRATDTSGLAPRTFALRRTFALHTAGRQRSLVLDFGSSATRVLLQDLDEHRWGFLPLVPRTTDSLDLASDVFFAEEGGVSFGAEAVMHWRRGSPGRHVASIKQLALSNEPDAAAYLARALPALVERVYTPLRESTEPVLCLRDRESIPLSGGPRGQWVVMVPDDAPPAYVRGMENALQASCWDGACAWLSEAEAVGLWIAQTIFGAPPPCLERPGQRLKLVVLDIGGGTTDAAIIEASALAAAGLDLTEPPIRVLAAGSSSTAGRALDEALLWALCRRVGIDPSDVPASTVEDLRPDLEHAKSLGRIDPSAEIALRITTERGDKLAHAPLSELFASEGWHDAVNQVVSDAFDLLMGRSGASSLSDIDLVVLTGRGALTAGLDGHVERFVVRLGGPKGRVHRVEERWLKAAVSLGARLYVLGHGGSGFVPSRRVHRDRILLLVRRAGEPVSAIELLPAEQAAPAGPIEGPWKDVPPWEDAVVVRTWMVPIDHPATQPWELDARRMLMLLRGEPLDVATAGTPPERFPDALRDVRFASGPVDAPVARMRVVVDAGFKVAVEWQGPERRP